MRRPNRGINYRTLGALFGVLTITIMLIIGSSSFPNIVLSKSSSLNNKPSSHVPLLSNGGISSNSGIHASNLNGFHNQSSSASLHSAPPPSSSTSAGDNISSGVTSSNNKVVMINFDDGWKTQMTFAKPILDKYDFKASFFVVCNYVTSGDAKRMNWQDIAALQRDGMDIESHTMDHKPLNKMSLAKLDYEIGGSKQCLANHGVNTTIFGYPFNLGSDKPTVVNVVAKYYNLGRSGTDPLMFLNCNGYVNHPQSDCRTYSANGKLNYVNRYDIRSASFYHISNKHNFSPPEMFQVFLQIINSQIPSNSNGKINAIPVIVYHNITNNIQDYTPASKASTVTVDLFAQEMKYLHDNGFKVLLLNQFGFDATNNIFYLKNVPSSTSGTTTNAATLLSGAPSYSISNAK